MRRRAARSTPSPQISDCAWPGESPVCLRRSSALRRAEFQDSGRRRAAWITTFGLVKSPCGRAASESPGAWGTHRQDRAALAGGSVTRCPASSSVQRGNDPLTPPYYSSALQAGLVSNTSNQKNSRRLPPHRCSRLGGRGRKALHIPREQPSGARQPRLEIASIARDQHRGPSRLVPHRSTVTWVRGPRWRA